jgi:hypothetical protein
MNQREADMPNPSKAWVLGACVQGMFCGALILSAAPPLAAGQNPEREEAQTENVRPLFYFTTAGPPGLRVAPWVKPVYPSVASFAVD